MPSFRDRLRLCVLTVFRRGRSTGASSTSSSSSTRRAPRASHASRVPHVTARSPLLRKLGVLRNNGRRFPAPFLPLDPDVPRSGCPGRRPAVGAARLTCRALPDRAASGQLRVKRKDLTHSGPHVWGRPMFTVGCPLPLRAAGHDQGRCAPAFPRKRPAQLRGSFATIKRELVDARRWPTSYPRTDEVG